jgi:hypothetical protein
VSDFFTAPPPPEPEPEHAQPEWLGPPDNELGVAVPMRVVLARTREVAVAVADVVAYSTGIELGLAVRLRALDELADPYGMHYGRMRMGRAELNDAMLRFGAEFSDGRRVTNIDRFPAADPTRKQADPVLVQRGGGGGGKTWDMRMWLWPLPPQGTLALVCEWPKHGIELTRVEVDTAPILEAAAAVDELWPGGGPSPGGGFVTSSIAK